MEKQTSEKEYMKQWSKYMKWFFDYIPTKQKADDAQWKIRKTIWNFKNGKCPLQAGAFIGNAILKQFGTEAKNIVFACIPASTSIKNEIRYKDFSEVVCRVSGAINAYDAISIANDRLAIHESEHRKRIDTVNVINFDHHFFKEKKVLLFDDIITLGYSYARFACELEHMGANVLGGIFLGRTLDTCQN